MSDEETKERRSRRLHQEQAAIKRQIQIAKTNHTPDTYITEPHRYHKHHVMNCGNPKCHMCGNPRKVFKDKTIQELSFEQTDKWE
jgi:hypothetical protein